MSQLLEDLGYEVLRVNDFIKQIYLNQTFTLPSADSTRPIDYSVSDSKVVFAPAPTPSS